MSLFLDRFPFTLLFLFRCRCRFRFRFRFRFLFPFPFFIPESGFRLFQTPLSEILERETGSDTRLRSVKVKCPDLGVLPRGRFAR